MDSTNASPPLSHEDPLTEASETLADLIEHYERQKNWILRVQESVQRVQSQSRTPSPASAQSSNATPSRASHQQLHSQPQFNVHDPRARTFQPTPVLNVANLLQIYDSIVSERVESCKRTAELIREADRLSLERFESTHTYDFGRPR